MPTKLFITRELSADSPLRHFGGDLIVVGQSCLTFKWLPFGEFPKAKWICFYSQRGIDYSLCHQAFAAYCRQANVFTFGNKTAQYLDNHHGITPRFSCQSSKHTAPKTIKQYIAQGEQILFVQGWQSRRTIQSLEEFSHSFEELYVYDSLHDASNITDANIIIFTSPMNADAYLYANEIAEGSTLISIGQTTQQHLIDKYRLQSLTPATPSEEALAKLVVNLL